MSSIDYTKLINKPPYKAEYRSFTMEGLLNLIMGKDTSLITFLNDRPYPNHPDWFSYPISYVESEKFAKLMFRNDDMGRIAKMLTQHTNEQLQDEGSDLLVDVFVDGDEEFAFKVRHTNYTGEETDDLLNI